MSDTEIATLERAHKADPTDDEVLKRLERAWFRAGRGWHGEPWAETVLRNGKLQSVLGSGSRGIYNVCRRNDAKAPLIQLVYVPGDDKRAIAPHYIGRYPVTSGEWLSFCHAMRRPPYHESPTRPGTWVISEGLAVTHEPHNPAVNVSHADAIAFCDWAGLRLPTQAEWKWAALGGPCDAPEAVPYDGPCAGHTRRYPWGNELPTPERCVWPGLHGSTAPVVAPYLKWCPAWHREGPHDSISCRDCVRGELGPARPAGASWCGAQDMAGNVWEWTARRTALGGSFRSLLAHSTPMCWEPEARDDIGLRVALSAS